MAKRRVYCIFEGAGARGIAHVGALKALEDASEDVEIIGFAGTSAGSLAAVLASVGYKADDLYCPGNRQSILGILKDQDGGDPAEASPKDLFGDSAWNTLMALRRFWSGNPVAMLAGGLLLVLLVFGTLFAPSILMRLSFLAVLLVLIWWLVRWILNGAVALDPVAGALDKLLVAQLPEGARLTGKEGRMSFADHARHFLPLRIVSTNLSDRKLDLWSLETTPDALVSEAVAASIAIPFVFKPRWIGSEDDKKLHIDGGIVSNLPAWAFDGESELDPDALKAAFEFAKKEPAPIKRLSLAAILDTGFFKGASALSKRQVSGLYVQQLRVEVPPGDGDDAVNIGLLDFNMTHDQAAIVHKAAREDTKADLVQSMIQLPDTINANCALVSDQIRDFFQMVFGGKVDVTNYTFRVTIAFRTSAARDRVRFVAGHGFSPHADEAITLPFEAFLPEPDAGSRFVTVGQSSPLHSALGGSEFRWIAKRYWRDAKWLMIVPLDTPAEGVSSYIFIDSDLELALTSDVLEELKLSLEPTILGNYDPLKDQLAEYGDAIQATIIA